MAGVIGLVTGAYTLVTSRGSWLALAGRKTGAGLAIGALVAVVVGSSVYGATGMPAATTTPPAEQAAVDRTPAPTLASPTATATPTTSPTPTAAAADTALALLATLPVKGRAPKTGYDRTGVFGPAWKDVDRNGCDTRNDILRRDLTNVTIKAGTHGCLVLAGSLADPYTGKKISFVRGQTTSSAVQIDHVVALMDAWQSGAQQIGQARREALANDPLNLLAVDGPSNEQKGAGNAATWLPPVKGYRCAYLARQITVKAAYTLWVTQPEHDAMAQILSTCPDQKVATAGSITLMPDAVGTAPAPAPKPVAPSQPAPSKPAAPLVVHPGAYCAPVGAHGVTSKGTPMACTLKSGEARARWRAS
ncbi:DUF1524 domain-containing protein [Microbacterium sp. SYP-A9085]|nr:DUF1524 domain-containing protein [Microbacterium sp. SYP-A9085]